MLTIKISNLSMLLEDEKYWQTSSSASKKTPTQEQLSKVLHDEQSQLVNALQHYHPEGGINQVSLLFFYSLI